MCIIKIDKTLLRQTPIIKLSKRTYIIITQSNDIKLKKVSKSLRSYGIGHMDYTRRCMRTHTHIPTHT